MALSANTVWEVRTTGSDSNGGGFVSTASGTDYSQQDSSQYSFTDLASSNGTSSTPSVSSASHSFIAADVGNILRVTAGTNWTAGFYEITAVGSGNATLDRACGSSASLSAGSYVVGGAFASPGQAGAAKVSGLSGGGNVYIKAGTYTLTTTSTNVSGGAVVITLTATSTKTSHWMGYYANRWTTAPASDDLANPPVISAGSQSGFTLFNFNVGTNVYVDVYNIVFDGNNQTSVVGMSTTATSNGVSITRTKFQNCTTGFLVSTGSNVALQFCVFTNCTTGLSNSATSNSIRVIGCIANGCTTGFSFNYISSVYRCIAYGNTTNFAVTGRGVTFMHCTAANGSTAGFDSSGSTQDTKLINCVAYSTTGTDYNLDATVDTPMLLSCAGRAAGTGYDSTKWPVVEDYITLTTDPFTNGASGDFSLNNTSGGGASCKNVPFSYHPTYAPATIYRDMGAVQSLPTQAVLLGQTGVLAQKSPSASTLTSFYECESGVTATVKKMLVCNTNSTPVTFRLSVQVAAAADATKQYTHYNYGLAANDTATVNLGIILSGGDILMVYASSTGVNFTAFGVVV